MAVLQYVQQKKKERDLHIKEGMSHGAHRKWYFKL
jgi:hypothetical protein